MIFRFESPELLWLLLLVPLISILRGREGSTAAVRFSTTLLARQIAMLVRSQPGRFLVSLRLLALSTLIIAIARPQLGSGTSEIEASGIDIVLTVDLSSSMWAHDFEINNKPSDRLTVVKQVMEDFIKKRPNDRIGIIAFAGEPYLVSPLTLNHGWLLKSLERLKIGLIEDGTAIGSAIGISVNRLRAQAAKSRIVILLTDGANNRGKITPVAAAEAAAAFNIKIYTIGAGREGLVPMPQFNRLGQPLRDRRGNIILARAESDVDIKTLKNVADKTNAHFFRATDTQSLKSIYGEIDRLEKTSIKMKYRASFKDIFMWPALIFLALLGLEQLLSNTRYRRLP